MPPPYEPIFGQSSPAINRDVWDILPTEILQQIFLYASPNVYRDPEPVEVRISQATIASCTRVCVAWRAAAFSRRELWACMVDVQRQSVPYLRHLLETSAPHPFNIGHRSAPISFWGPDTNDREYHHVPEIWDLVEHQTRIREFHVVWNEYKGVATILNSRDILALAELNMPYLESLSCGRAFTSRSPRPIPRNAMTGPHTLVPQPHSQHLPRLTKILAQCTDLPLPVRWPNLTELSLISPPRRPTCLELIKFLQTTPRMRFLPLNDAVNPVGLTLLSVSSLPCTKLPHLTLLTVKGKDIEQLAGLAQILKSLPFGTSEACGFQIIICPPIPREPPYLMTCLEYVGTQIDRGIKNVLPANATNLPLQFVLDPTTGVCVLSTIVSGDPSAALDFASCGSGKVVEALNRLGGRAWSLQTQGIKAATTVWLMGSVNPLVTSLRVRVVKLNRLAGSTNLNTRKGPALGEGVCTFLQLTTITLDQKAATLVLPLLVSDPKAARDPWALPLPRLKSITLESCDCTPFSELFRTLQSFLEERAALKNPIVEVTFIRSSISVAEVLDLGERLWCYMVFKPDHTV